MPVKKTRVRNISAKASTQIATNCPHILYKSFRFILRLKVFL